MDYKLAQLPNGLRIITVPMPSLESATVTVWVATGSRFETAPKSGLSHFLEHMVFKGTRKRPTARDVSEAVDEIGGEFNAGTNKEWTNFHIKARAGSLDTAYDVLSDMILNSLLRPQDIEREKGVIIEEIGLYEDTPMRKVWDIFEQLIFEGNPLGRDIIGTRETVQGIERTDFLRYIDTHYHTDNILVTVAGGIADKKVLDMTQKYFGNLKKGEKDLAKQFKSGQKGPRVRLENQKREQTNLILGFLGNPMGHKDRYVEAVLSSILGGGMSSRLFTEIREKRGLAYSVKSTTDHSVDTGYFASYAGVDPKKADEAVKVMLEEHLKLVDGKKDLVTEKELKKSKEYLKGHLALSLEDTESVNSFFGIEELLLGSIRTPEEVFTGIDKVSLEDVQRVAQEFFKPQRLNLALIGPHQDKERFERLLK